MSTNEYVLSGIWVFNKTIALPNARTAQSITFRSGGNSFKNIDPNPSTMYYHYTDSNNMVIVYTGDPANWGYDRYRLIIFDEPQTVSAEFYEWFIDNATPGDALKDDIFAKCTITYLGRDIDMQSTSTITLKCMNKVFGSDVVIRNKGSSRLSDITGTTWVVPAGTKTPVTIGNFYVFGCVTASTNTYDSTYRIQISAHSSTRHISINYGNATSFILSQTSELTFSFYGGDDATNATLIDWLYENAELQMDTIPDRIVHVSYNDTQLATASSGQTLTLHCGGKKALTDIVLTSATTDTL